MPTSIDKRLAKGMLLAIVLLIAAAAWQWRDGPPISSDVLELLPTSGVQRDPLMQRAQTQVEAPLNRELVALIGSPTRDSAAKLASQLRDDWAASGLFSRVVLEPTLDTGTLRHDLTARRIAMLAAKDRSLLMSDPLAYATQRAQALFNPFNPAILLAPAQDWLGLGASIERQLRPESRVALDLSSGMLTVEDQGITWVLLRASSIGNAFDGDAPANVATLVERGRERLASAGATMLVTGGVLYAAHGKKQAIKEIGWISFLSLAGIVLVLVLALRGTRTILVFVPVAVGLLAGITACVAVFGHIHAVTLVIGTTLIGVVVDFPMHWLGKRYGMPDWQAWPAMRLVLPGLSISFAANLIGYLALGLTPFPALQQTAIFSGAGLLAAFATTVCLLPACCRDWQPRPSPALQRGAVYALRAPAWLRAKRWRKWTAIACLALVGAGGIAKLSVHDDLRLWLNLPAPLLNDAVALGKLTGFMPTSQFFFVHGTDEADVLARSGALQIALDGLIADGKLASYSSIASTVASAESQTALKQRLRDLALESAPWAPLTQLGVPLAHIHQELRELASLPTLNIAQTLNTPLAERWHGLWLTDEHGLAAIVTLSGLRDISALKARTAKESAIFVDRTGDLNTLFAHTRITAAELKIASYAIAGLLLWLVLGRSATWRILLAPIAATCSSLAVLGYLGHPLTLFGLFGLLLVSAIGIDYAVFMYERVAGAAASLTGILLSATTTVLGFGLLMLSDTPVIANFGLAVTIGVTFSLMFAAFVTPIAPHAIAASGIRKT